MSKKEFFDDQTDLTASKILIYQKYLSSFLPKVLMKYGRCFIADIFCGCGKNGDKEGSPLVLIEVARKSLEIPVIKARWPNAEIIIVFSDADKHCCDNLTELLKSYSLPAGVKVLGPYCEDFHSIKKEIAAAFDKIQAPKFFFLDPFTYSDIGIDDVKAFMDMPAAEVLLFLPTFHSYRFVKCANEVGALKKFLESFTDRGCADYASINDFNESIRQRLLKYIGLDYVRSVGLDNGAQKNALFYLTKHITGMLLMNDLVWKIASDGVTVKAKRDDGLTLFDLSAVSDNFSRSKDMFLSHLAVVKSMSNKEIIDFVARNCFATKYANEILKDLKKQGVIKVEYKRMDKTRGFYVSGNHWNEELAIITYKG